MNQHAIPATVDLALSPSTSTDHDSKRADADRRAWSEAARPWLLAAGSCAHRRDERRGRCHAVRSAIAQHRWQRLPRWQEAERRRVLCCATTAGRHGRGLNPTLKPTAPRPLWYIGTAKLTPPHVQLAGVSYERGHTGATAGPCRWQCARECRRSRGFSRCTAVASTSKFHKKDGRRATGG